MKVQYLIAGSRGQLGMEFVRHFDSRGVKYFAFDIDQVDIGSLDELQQVFEAYMPVIVINCAAYNNVDAAEDNFALAYRSNALGVRNLAYLSKKYGSTMVHYGTDYVFDGTKMNGFYTEDDMPNPVNGYARSKYLGEIMLAEELDRYLLLRVSWVYGEGKQNFIHKFLQWCKSKDFLQVAFDEISVPTYTKTIVDTTLAALDRGLSGLFHLTCGGYCSRYEWAKLITKTLGLDKVIYPISKDNFDLPAKRPGFSAMSNKKISGELSIELPDWEETVKGYLMKIEKNV